MFILSLTPSCHLYTNEYISCNDLVQETYVSDVRLTANVSASKTVTSVPLSGIKVSVYGYDANGTAYPLFESQTVSSAQVKDGLNLSLSRQGSDFRAYFLCERVRLDVTASGTAYFSDGSTLSIPQETVSVFAQCHEGVDIYSGLSCRSVSEITYDYSSLRVNGVVPAKVMANGTQIFRLRANNTDIIHKFVSGMIRFMFSPELSFYTGQETSCSTSHDSTYADRASLGISWGTAKSVSRLSLSSVTVSAYAYDAAGQSALMYRSNPASVSTDSFSVQLSLSASSRPDLELFCKRVRLDVTVAGTAYFSDGSTLSIPQETVSTYVSVTGEGWKTAAASVARDIAMKEY
ncbi:MAG: hypothetical protein IJP62_05630 [Treponema sp.]|nr:hypothetical protein [Treponema sp.]